MLISNSLNLPFTAMPICSVSSRQCYDDGKEFAEQALVFDQAGDIAAAIFYYTEAANVLLTAINVDPRFGNFIVHLRLNSDGRQNFLAGYVDLIRNL